MNKARFSPLDNLYLVGGKYYQINQEAMFVNIMLQIKFLVSTKAAVNHVRKDYRWLQRGGPISVGSLRMTYF